MMAAHHSADPNSDRVASNAAECSWIDITLVTAAPFGLSLVTTWLCRIAAGESLGLYFGPIAVISMILPQIVAAQHDLFRSILITAMIVSGVGLAWLIAVLASDTTILQWLGACLILATYAAASCAGVRALMRWMAPLAAAAVVTIAGLLWLSWPVWHAPRITDSLASWLGPANPIFAMNRLLIDRGIWTQQRLMYQLTTLGQDVPYNLPKTIWPSVMIHLFMALALWWVASRPTRLKTASPAHSHRASRAR